MLRITVEMIPQGDLDKVRPIGIMYITNDGTGTRTRGNYDVIIVRKRDFMDRFHAVPWRATRVVDFPRGQYHSWYLLHTALETLGLVTKKLRRKYGP